MAVERRLTEIVGPLGGKLHTGRSRNDQVATDLALFVAHHAERAGRADRALSWRRSSTSPSATPTGRCPATRTFSARSPSTWRITSSPTSGCSGATLGASRRRAIAALAEMPLGSGALAGLNWDLDRDATAADLGFAAPSPNSIDAVSNRDAALDYLSAAAICAAHLSRLGSELVIWSSQEFGFCRAGRRLRLGLFDHAAEEEPRRGRAPARQGAAGRRLVLDPDRRAPRAAARLRQGPPGGQGGALRRRGHDRDVPGGRGADACAA